MTNYDITGKFTGDSVGVPDVPGTYLINANELVLGFGANRNLKSEDMFSITFKTPITGTLNSMKVWFWDPLTGSNGRRTVVVTWSTQLVTPLPFSEQLKTASANNPIKIIVKVPGRPNVNTFGDLVTYSGWVDNFIQWDFSGLHIDFKKVKGISYDSKNWKEFLIDGHLYNFRRANLPADEQTELSVLIDALDFSALAYTGAALTANQLTWADLIGEPALHTGVSVTGITHPAIDATGTLSANITFHRVLSDGTVEDYTKAVNIAFNLQLKPASSVWYGDDTGNIYKDGVKTYLLKDETWNPAHDFSSMTFNDLIQVGSDIWSATSYKPGRGGTKTYLYKNDKWVGTVVGAPNLKFAFNDGTNLVMVSKTKAWKCAVSDLKRDENTSVGTTYPFSNDGVNSYYFDNRVWYSELARNNDGNLRYTDITNGESHQYGPNDLIGWGASGDQMILGKTADGDYYGISVGQNGASIGSIRIFKGTQHTGVQANKQVSYYVKVVDDMNYLLYVFNNMAMKVYTINFTAMTITDASLDISGATSSDFTTKSDITKFLVDDKFYIALSDKKILEYDVAANTRTVKYTTEGTIPTVDWTGSRGA